MKIYLAFIIIFLGYLFSFNSVYAVEKVNPDGGFRYQAKRLGEKIVLLTKITPTLKADYYQRLLDKRLAELVYIVENKDLANIEKTSQRYEATAGFLTELIKSKNLVNKYESTKNLFEKHINEIELIKGEFEYGTGERRLVQNDINFLKICLDLLR